MCGTEPTWAEIGGSQKNDHRKKLKYIGKKHTKTVFISKNNTTRLLFRVDLAIRFIYQTEQEYCFFL